MPWFYVDDGFSDSKPVLNMPDRYRLAACGLWTLAGSWSAKEELDGFVPKSKLRQLGARAPIIAALTDSGPMSAPLCTQVEGGIQFNSWSKWQKTRAELIEKRREDADRQRAWRDANPENKSVRKTKGRNAVTSSNAEVSQRDKHVTNNVTNNVTNSVSHSGVTTDASRARTRGPDPTRPDPTPNGQFERETHVSSDPDPNDPPPKFCRQHMPGGTLEKCGACKQARTIRDEWTGRQSAHRIQQLEAHAAQRRAQRQADARTRQDAINECTLCGPDGYRAGIVCDHIDRTSTARAGMAAVRAALGQPHQLDDNQEAPHVQ